MPCFAVDVGDRALAARGRGEARVVGEHAGLAVELADVDDLGTDRPVEQQELVIGSLRHPGWQSCRSFVRLHLVGDAGEAFVPPKQRKHIKNPRRGRAPGEGSAKRLGKLAELHAAALRDLADGRL